MKVEKGNLVKKAPPDQSPKKKSKEEKGKSIASEDTPTTSHILYLSVLVGGSSNLVLRLRNWQRNSVLSKTERHHLKHHLDRAQATS
ncbi:hypothetical protein PIB30_082233 [Stylosanthes scabra]|uniref:Uncharacterized protein n=1 Tax=Stylosanthes scabra TaxID=79078 RepID=A0ABU6XQ15_9FABA|nr:hypothetical protein [Stylosanthes scabra]